MKTSLILIILGVLLSACGTNLTPPEPDNVPPDISQVDDRVVIRNTLNTAVTAVLTMSDS